ncbi:MAG: serine hydrolase domain-containing protein [Pseudomonadota bacterium]
MAVLVLHDGKPVCEHYKGRNPATAHELWSGTKSFVGIMAAAAVQDGILTLDERVSTTISEWQQDPVRKTITIRHLLTMTSGQPSAIGRPPTYADSLRIGLTAEPGTRFQYGPTPMQTFGELLRRKLIARGESGNPVAYLQRRVLDPIGLKVAEWRDGPDGNPLLPQGAVLTASEWAKIGEFVRGGGKAGGRQIVDPATFAALFQPSKVNPAYGLTWWLPHPSTVADPVTASTDIGRRASELPADLVVAAGAGDQRLYVIPSKGLTIVRQARLDLVAAIRREPNGWSDADFLTILLR